MLGVCFLVRHEVGLACQYSGHVSTEARSSGGLAEEQGVCQ
jgi:hypothetical protein